MAATTRRTVERKDPRPRPIDAMTGMVTLRDRDPSLTYLWVPEVGFFDVEYYQSCGWQKCLRQEGSARPLRGGSGEKEGYITQMGNILMCRPKAEHVDEYQAGQEDTDRIEKSIFDQSFGRRLTRRIAGPSVIDVENQSVG